MSTDGFGNFEDRYEHETDWEYGARALKYLLDTGLTGFLSDEALTLARSAADTILNPRHVRPEVLEQVRIVAQRIDAVKPSRLAPASPSGASIGIADFLTGSVLAPATIAVQAPARAPEALPAPVQVPKPAPVPKPVYRAPAPVVVPDCDDPF